MSVHVWVALETGVGISVHTTKQHAMDTHARRFQLRMRAGLCRWRPTGDSGWALEDDDVGRVVAVYPAPLEGPA